METIFTGAFSEPDATATPWAETEQVLRSADLSWLSTVRADGRPHVTPLVGVWFDTAAWFTTGDDEQKAHNLARSPLVALTTGTNTWAGGLDVVVEGTAERVRERADLERAVAAYDAKYAGDWPFEVAEGGLAQEGHVAGLWRIRPSKVLAFAKGPHGQTTYRF